MLIVSCIVSTYFKWTLWFLRFVCFGRGSWADAYAFRREQANLSLLQDIYRHTGWHTQFFIRLNFDNSISAQKIWEIQRVSWWPDDTGMEDHVTKPLNT